MPTNWLFILMIPPCFTFSSVKNISGSLTRWFVIVDQFKPTIKYLLGKANVTADTLSRNVAVASVSEIINFSWEELFAAQRQDLLWSAVVYALKICDESVLPKLHVPLSQFSLVNGILCRTVSVQKQTVTQLVIPTSLVPSMLQLIHDAPQFGHPGRGKSLTMAHKRY